MLWRADAGRGRQLMETAWQDLIAAYERTVVAYERALDDDGGVPSLPAFSPPADPPTVAPTGAERDHFADLEERARACDRRVRAALEGVVAKIDRTRRATAAARAYGDAGHRHSA